LSIEEYFRIYLIPLLIPLALVAGSALLYRSKPKGPVLLMLLSAAFITVRVFVGHGMAALGRWRPTWIADLSSFLGNFSDVAYLGFGLGLVWYALSERRSKLTNADHLTNG
jgi:hypothetical protein